MNNLNKLVQAIPAGMDGILITSDVNRKYFTGMSSSAGTLLATREKCYFIIDFRYIELAKKTITGAEVMLQDKLKAQLGEIATKHNIKVLGIENDRTPVSEYLTLKETFPGVEIPMDDTVEKLITEMRKYKTREEVDCILKAQSFAEKGFDEVLNFIKIGKTELEIAACIEYYSRLAGSEGASFDSIVVSGENSSLPHGKPTSKAVAAGDFLTMDFGSTYNGYCSDMTRTVAIGHTTEEMELVYNTVLKAQLESEAAIKVGVPCRVIDKVARDIIYGAGFEGRFGHGLGHGLGLEVHEQPRFSAAVAEDVLCEPGLVMSVEPGIYLPGKFGVRIEDLVYITNDGYENLTACEKKLIVIK